MKSYLIQRATSYDAFKFTPPKENKGIDKLVRWDYMGSAEYEFNSLFKAMQRVKNNIKLFELFDFEKTANGYPVYVFCKKEKKDEIFVLLNELKDFNKYYYLKEQISFDKWFNPKINSPSKKELKKVRTVHDETIYCDNDNNWYIKQKNEDKIVWQEARRLENFWFDIENDFMFFVDYDNLKSKFLKELKGE